MGELRRHVRIILADLKKHSSEISQKVDNSSLEEISKIVEILPTRPMVTELKENLDSTLAAYKKDNEYFKNENLQ